MHFELGLTVGQISHGGPEHSWFVFERMPYRLQKSLSDLNGTDVYVHGGSVSGVFRELLSAFVREHRQPTVGQTAIDEALKKSLPKILHETGASSPFTASAFKHSSDPSAYEGATPHVVAGPMRTHSLMGERCI
jgi:hypothetical protein